MMFSQGITEIMARAAQLFEVMRSAAMTEKEIAGLMQMPARKAGTSRLDQLLYELDEGIRSRALPENA
jgi:hypothetical protein